MIDTPIITNEALLNLVQDFYTNYTLFLINDANGDLNETSLMIDFANLEITEGNGYSRRLLTFDPFTISGSSATTTVQEELIDITSNSIVITHLCCAVGASLINKDTSGIIERALPISDGNQVTYVSGNSVTLDKYTINQNASLK